MTTVLAALDANASAKPVLDTALAIATLFDATATALHVRENGAGAARELTGAAGAVLTYVQRCGGGGEQGRDREGGIEHGFRGGVGVERREDGGHVYVTSLAIVGRARRSAGRGSARSVRRLG